MKSIAIGLIFFSSIVFANPIVITPGTTPIELFALFSESLIVALLLTNYKFHFFRVLFMWFIITFITYILFMWILAPMLVNLLGQTWLIPILILVEILIVITEAKIIQRMSFLKIFRGSKDLLLMKDAYRVSLIANLTSIVMGFIYYLR